MKFYINSLHSIRLPLRIWLLLEAVLLLVGLRLEVAPFLATKAFLDGTRDQLIR